VTGVGSGIGRALAIELAGAGARVASSDINTDGLAETERLLTDFATAPRVDRLDVSQRDAFTAYADEVNDHFGKVNQVYINTGTGFFGSAEVSQSKEIERVMATDFWGVVNGAKLFLPHLITYGTGHIVNVCSGFELFAVPYQSVIRHRTEQTLVRIRNIHLTDPARSRHTGHELLPERICRTPRSAGTPRRPPFHPCCARPELPRCLTQLREPPWRTHRQPRPGCW
jgi:NAD(P)-dependent dehydrogenase (short-subunit alcohol dehydrogenase family)